MADLNDRHGRASADIQCSMEEELRAFCNYLKRRVENRVGLSTTGGVADATQAGKLKTANNIKFTVKGVRYAKNAADNLWDLSGETDTDDESYRAYLLCLDKAGAASFVASGDKASANAAMADAMDLVPRDACVVGVFVAGPSTDFDDAGGLDAQGDIYDGFPEVMEFGEILRL